MYHAPVPQAGIEDLPVHFSNATALTYPERLDTFAYWIENETTARQLAALGHVCDRPPLEALEEGSHCVTCNAFVKRADSVKALEGPFNNSIIDHARGFDGFSLHHPRCDRLQVRIPLDTYITLPGYLSSARMSDVRNMWERRSKPAAKMRLGERHTQSSSLFSLPTELRLQIYSMILPVMDKVTPIMSLNRDSARIVTQMGYEKMGPRDMAKINLLCTCRAVHDEALDLLFTNITYKFDSTKLLYLFLRHIGSYGRQLLESIDILCHHREDAVAFSLLATCTKLKRINIRSRRPALMKPPRGLWIEDGVACLLELRGLKTVTFGEHAGHNAPGYLDDTKPDAAIVRRELTRPRGEKGGVRWVDGHLDL